MKVRDEVAEKLMAAWKLLFVGGATNSVIWYEYETSHQAGCGTKASIVYY